ncbi:MAG: AAA family ATPase, partial [Pseudomonadota bacterium]
MQRPIWNLLVERLKEESPLIQVLLGPRQVGKTTGILNVIEHWREPSHFASVDDTLIASPAWLTEQWQLALEKGPNTLLVIDEIQKIEDWSK